MPVSRRLERLLDRRAVALFRHLPGAVSGDVRAVHQARVATRRLREALPVFAAGLQGVKVRTTRRKLRRLTRALGGVREIDVSLAALDEMRPSAASQAATDVVRLRLRSLREERRREMLAGLDQVDTETLKVQIQRIGTHVDAVERSPIWRTRLSSRLAKRALALEDAVTHAGQVYAPELLHAVRIAAKKLRYTLELADEAGAAGTKAQVATLKRVQDTLGRIHDLVVLAAHATAVDASPDAHATVPPDANAVLVRSLETQCRRLHARYVGSASSLTALCAGVASTLAPGLRVAMISPRRRAPLKMALAAESRRSPGRVLTRRR